MKDFLYKIYQRIEYQKISSIHHRFAISVFFIILFVIIGLGVMYPEDEHSLLSNSNVIQSEDYRGRAHSDEGYMSTTDSGGKGTSHAQLLYDITSTERAQPWREVFQELSTVRVDNELSTLSGQSKLVSSNVKEDLLSAEVNNEVSLSDHQRLPENTNVNASEKNKKRTRAFHKDTESTHTSSKNRPVIVSKLVGIIHGDKSMAIIRYGEEEHMMAVGDRWKHITISDIAEQSIQLIEGGTSRWLSLE